MGSKHDLRQLMKIVYSRSNYRKFVLSMVSKHYSLQVIKFVLRDLTYTQSVKKSVSKQDFLQVMYSHICFRHED